MEKNRRGFLQILAYPSELGHFTSFLQVSGHDGKTEKMEWAVILRYFEYQKSEITNNS